MEQVIQLIKRILVLLNRYSGAITLVFAVVGGYFALKQWKTQVMHKRAEMVNDLMNRVRDDKDIAAIMDIIDWNEGIRYDGKFSVDRGVVKEVLLTVNNDALFKMIDKTLSFFSYICYLRKRKAISKKDMIPFEYELRRIADNNHIRDYLYSIYHWSKYLGVKCSFEHLIDYYLKKGYLSKDFKELNETGRYNCFLTIPGVR
jgi:hypothetical protein